MSRGAAVVVGGSINVGMFVNLESVVCVPALVTLSLAAHKEEGTLQVLQVLLKHCFVSCHG